MPPSVSALYAFVIEHKLLTIPDQLKPFSCVSDESLLDILKNTFQISEEALLQQLAIHLEIPFQRRHQLVQDSAWALFQKEVMAAQQIIPLYNDQDTLFIATANPYKDILNQPDYFQVKNIRLILIPAHDIRIHYQQALQKKPETLLEGWLVQAIEKHASDIHLYSTADGAVIKFRIQGELYEIKKLDPEEKKQLLSLIKLHAGMDIALYTQPQDGHISFQHNARSYDIRAATLPSVFGEDGVLRLFLGNHVQYSLAELGFTSITYPMISRMLNHESGLILVTGPTGSGKTTTLYACLMTLMQKKNKNIVTLEDPVETIIPGIRQSQINAKIDYDFAAGLRAVLRQDPDVIMIGEIRDPQTAKIALEAAYTGHLVLATLHTADCQTTLHRLMGFNLDRFLIAYCLRGIIAQKLFKRLCPHCRKAINPENETPDNFSAEGCPKCHYTGSSGRILVSEICEMDRAILKNENWQPETLLNHAQHYTFKEDYDYKIKSGWLQKGAKVA